MRQFFNTVYLLSKTHVDNIGEKVMSEAVLLVPSIVFAPDSRCCGSQMRVRSSREGWSSVRWVLVRCCKA